MDFPRHFFSPRCSCYGSLANNHCILARHFVFHVMSGVSSFTVTGGAPLRDILGGSEDNISRIKSCVVNIVSSKTCEGFFTIGRGSHCESIVLDDLCLWILKSGVVGDDDLVTRYPPSDEPRSRRNTLTRKEYQSVFRWLEKEVGVPTQSFSSKSCPLSYATIGELDGLSRSEINEGGGWSADSNVPNKVYSSPHIRKRSRKDREVDSGKDLGTWARDPSGKSSLTIEDVKVMGTTSATPSKTWIDYGAYPILGGSRDFVFGPLQVTFSNIIFIYHIHYFLSYIYKGLDDHLYLLFLPAQELLPGSRGSGVTAVCA